MSADQQTIDRLRRVAWGVVHNANKGPPQPRWVKVKAATALGSTSSVALCEEFGADPYQIVGGE